MAQRSNDSAPESTRPGAAPDDMPVTVRNPGARSAFLLVGDHAGRAIPTRLGDLGLTPEDAERHIAWDLGVEALGQRLADQIDATFISQRFSRLVIDCNRHLDDPASIATESDRTSIPGNLGLDQDERARRRREIFEPYHDAITRALDVQPARTLVSLHSFTPQLQGVARPWRVGVLHRDDSPLSRRVLAALRAVCGEDLIGDNAPYSMDGTDFTVPHHCDPRGIDYLELEVRQDTLAQPADVNAAADLLARVLSAKAQ